MASSSSSVDFLSGGGHWLVLGWLAGGVFSPDATSVTPVALLVPIGWLPGGGLFGWGWLVLGWLAGGVFSPGVAFVPPAALLRPEGGLPLGGLFEGGLVHGCLAGGVFSPSAASVPPAALLGPGGGLPVGRLFGGGLVRGPPLLSLSSLPSSSSSPMPSSPSGGEDAGSEGCDVDVGSSSKMSCLFQSTSSHMAAPRNVTPPGVGYSSSCSSNPGAYHGIVRRDRCGRTTQIIWPTCTYHCR
jgi:hypothetical protein